MMKLTPQYLAKLIIEEVTYELGPCLYVGRFKPPHIGHYESAKELASRSYVKEVQIVISPKTEDDITAQQSYAAWKLFLKCAPIPKVSVTLSPYPSPVQYAYKYAEARPAQKPIYLAGEEEGSDIFQSLQKRFGDQILGIVVDETRNLELERKMEQALNTGDYDKFKDLIPIAVVNKGEAQSLFKILTSVLTEQQTVFTPETLYLPDTTCSVTRLSEILNQQGYTLISSGNKEREAAVHKFVDYCCGLLDIMQRPELEIITSTEFPKQYRTFGTYAPDIKKLEVYIGNRNLADILRTLAHELVHHRQNELGYLHSKAGDTGSDIENEANAVAAMIMRNYGQSNPDIYE